MKKCYQLVILTEDGNRFDIIFSSLAKANKSLSFYPVGKEYVGSIIANSFICVRTLF